MAKYKTALYCLLIVFTLIGLLTSCARSPATPIVSETRSFELYYDEEASFLIYLGKGQQLHLGWIVDGEVVSAYILPNGTCFRLHRGNEYWIDERLPDLGSIRGKFSNINIRVGDTYDPLVQTTGNIQTTLIPGGTYEPGYYTIYFKSCEGVPRVIPKEMLEDELQRSLLEEIEPKFVTIRVEYWIE